MPMNEYGEIERPETISSGSSQSPQNSNNDNNKNHEVIIGILIWVILAICFYDYYNSKSMDSSQYQNANEPNYYEYVQETDDYTETDNYTSIERIDTPTPTPESPLAWVDGVTDVSTGKDIYIPGATSSSYVWPEANSRYYSESDLDGMTQGVVRYLINEIYARNGYIFKKQEWQAYFDQKDWYNPRIPYSEFDPKTYLNSYEYENVEMINRYQAANGYQEY